MKAIAIKEILVTAEHKLDGILVLETPCNNYEQYQTLPQVVSYNGTVLGKTGWSSDRCYACYQSNVKTAKYA